MGECADHSVLAHLMIASFPSVAEDYNGPFDSDSVRRHFNQSSKETVLEIALSESGIELEVAELQATELELSSAMLSLLPLT